MSRSGVVNAMRRASDETEDCDGGGGGRGTVAPVDDVVVGGGPFVAGMPVAGRALVVEAGVGTVVVGFLLLLLLFVVVVLALLLLLLLLLEVMLALVLLLLGVGEVSSGSERMSSCLLWSNGS